MQNLEQERQSLTALVNTFNERARLAGVPPFSMSCEDAATSKEAEIDYLNESSCNLPPLAAATLAERRGWAYLPGDDSFPIGNGNGALPSSLVEALRIAMVDESNAGFFHFFLMKGDWIIRMDVYDNGYGSPAHFVSI